MENEDDEEDLTAEVEAEIRAFIESHPGWAPHDARLHILLQELTEAWVIGCVGFDEELHLRKCVELTKINYCRTLGISPAVMQRIRPFIDDPDRLFVEACKALCVDDSLSEVCRFMNLVRLKTFDFLVKDDLEEDGEV